MRKTERQWLENYRYAGPREPNGWGLKKPTSGKYHFLGGKIPLAGQIATSPQKSKMSENLRPPASGRRKITDFRRNPGEYFRKCDN